MFKKIMALSIIESSGVRSDQCLHYHGRIPTTAPGCTSSRPAGYAQDKSRDNLVRQMASLYQYSTPPKRSHGRRRRRPEGPPIPLPFTHLPVASPNRGNCSHCYQQQNEEVKAMFTCSMCTNSNNRPLFLCIKNDRQCFREYHEAM